MKLRKIIQYMEGFKMNSLLSKFENVKIENDVRISEIDRKYCEKEENMYRESITAMNNTLDLFKTIHKLHIEEKDNSSHYHYEYIDHYEDIRHIEDRIKKIKNNFISNITGHFQRVYNVTLESGEIKQKYDISVTYQNIVDEIFEQLGGFNFEEKAVKELKDKCRETIYRGDKITINKNILTIADFVWWDHYSWEGHRIGYSDSKVSPLFKALSHFETDETETLFYYQNIYKQLSEGEKRYSIFNKYEIGYNLVNSVKFFKNGKIEITFQTNQQAEEFKREYLTK
jgi:hypothetical protein